MYNQRLFFNKVKVTVRLRVFEVCNFIWGYINEKTRTLCGCAGLIIIVAATYFSEFDPSIIGGAGLNGSVRDGKRWTPVL
jgi:hypothetical protein